MARYAVVLTDQRGCGRSNGTLATNTPEILVQDLEAVREAVGADRCAPGTLANGSLGQSLQRSVGVARSQTLHCTTQSVHQGLADGDPCGGGSSNCSCESAGACSWMYGW